ncbi:hypothetical protein MNBD_GAMMA10-2307 [hydrothermal vent metagenome]|uniref:SPOR domain-containing protein n=1 Tax=hydrothermal vent metagenome TaxID=652676 RepID=A0A3B0XZK1_9ZZZZ
MDRKLRKRLTGAVVLAAFLVILVPEWLDGAGHNSRYGNKVRIPDRPEFKPISDYMVDNVANNMANNMVSNITTDTPATPIQQPASVNPSARPEAVSIHAWALQLGSFFQEQNAEAMRDDLRAKGYAGYVDVLKKPGRIVYRVRIGPELDKRQLEKLKAEILKKEKIEGLVVRHP